MLLCCDSVTLALQTHSGSAHAEHVERTCIQTAYLFRKLKVHMQAGSVSKIHSFPAEVLGHVFVLGCPALEAHLNIRRGRGPAGYQVRRYQALVGSVCSRWRQISHETPSLWAAMLVNWQNVLVSDVRKAAIHDSMLELSIKRSGALDIDVAIICPLFESVLTSKSSNLFIKALPRIRRLSVQCQVYPESAINRSHTLFPIQNAPRLQVLELMDIHSIKNTSLFAKNPNVSLRDFRLIGCGESLKLSNIPCNNVRTFVAVISTASAVQSFMKRCRNLHSARLLDVSDAENGLEIPSSLREFDFRYSMWSGTHAPMAILQNLAHVSIHISTWTSGPDDAFPVDNHHSASLPLPSLLSLSFCAGSAWAAHIVRTLERAPNLVALELNQCLIDPIYDCMDQLAIKIPSDRTMHLETCDCFESQMT